MKAIGLVLVLVAAPVFAQEPVNRAADVISWGTAAVNPTIAVVKAFRADQTKCHLGQIAISAALVNSTGLLLQHFVVSPRPCCPGNGRPSLHAGNAGIGASWDWRVSWAFSLVTAEERERARRHTWQQALEGMALGLVSEWAGQHLVRCPT